MKTKSFIISFKSRREKAKFVGFKYVEKVCYNWNIFEYFDALDIGKWENEILWIAVIKEFNR